MRWGAVAALLPGLALGFEWGEVPKATQVTPLHGTLDASGVPVKATEVLSSEEPAALAKHFFRRFLEAGLYVPPAAEQAKVRGAWQLSAFDPEERVSYTVMMKPRKSGAVRLILGEAHFGALRPTGGAQVAPVFPGATSVVSSDVEQARMVAFSTTGTAAEVESFYRDTLGAAGYRESEPGVFRKGAEEINVYLKVAGAAVKVAVFKRVAR